jgi:hypothetical protein
MHKNMSQNSREWMAILLLTGYVHLLPPSPNLNHTYRITDTAAPSTLIQWSTQIQITSPLHTLTAAITRSQEVRTQDIKNKNPPQAPTPSQKYNHITLPQMVTIQKEAKTKETNIKHTEKVPHKPK